MKYKKLSLFLTAAIILAAVSAIPHAYAQETQKNGVTVAPAFLTMQIGSLQPETTASVGVKNNTAATLNFNATAGGLEVQENSLVLGDKPEEALVEAVTVSPAAFKLAPGESVNVQITVRNTDRVPPGGHYLSLLIRQSAAVPGQVSLDSAVSATIFIIKEDGAVRNLNADSVSMQRSLFKFPGYVDIAFRNDGNVAAVPRGIATIRKSGSGEILSRGVINENSLPVFQDQVLKLRAEFKRDMSPVWPGKYTLEVQYRYDGAEQERMASLEFWYVPKALVIGIAVMLVIAFWTSRPRQRQFIGRRFRKFRLWADGKLPDKRSKMQKNKNNPAEKTAPESPETKKVRIITDIHKKQ